MNYDDYEAWENYRYMYELLKDAGVIDPSRFLTRPDERIYHKPKSRDEIDLCLNGPHVEERDYER